MHILILNKAFESDRVQSQGQWRSQTQNISISHLICSRMCDSISCMFTGRNLSVTHHCTDLQIIVNTSEWDDGV